MTIKFEHITNLFDKNIGFYSIENMNKAIFSVYPREGSRIDDIHALIEFMNKNDIEYIFKEKQKSVEELSLEYIKSNTEAMDGIMEMNKNIIQIAFIDGYNKAKEEIQ